MLYESRGSESHNRVHLSFFFNVLDSPLPRKRLIASEIEGAEASGRDIDRCSIECAAVPDCSHPMLIDEVVIEGSLQ